MRQGRDSPRFSGPAGGSPLHRQDPTPLWAQLADILRAEIADGSFDDRFPTEAELKTRFDVSRHTVREALRRLAAEGLIERRQGRGTTVRPREFRQDPGALYSLFRSIEDRGVPQTSRVLDIGPRTDAEAARRLALGPTARLFFLQRIRFAGDTPLALDRVWLPWEVGAPLVDADFTRTALYDVMLERLGYRPDAGVEVVRPAIVAETEAGLLDVDPGTPIFVVERETTYGGRPVEVRQTLVRGDRFAFQAHWSGSEDRVPSD